MAWFSASRDDKTRYAVERNFDHQMPRFQCHTPLTRYRDWALYPVYSVILGEDEGWRFTPLAMLLEQRRVWMLVFLPLFCWQLSILVLRLLSRISFAGTTPAFHVMDRRAALIDVSRAAFVAVRVAWIGVFLLVVPFLTAPGTTHSFRSAAFGALLGIGTVGPFVVATRSWCADQVFCQTRGRVIPLLSLLLFGFTLPARGGAQLIYAATYLIGKPAQRGLENAG